MSKSPTFTVRQDGDHGFNEDSLASAIDAMVVMTAHYPLGVSIKNLESGGNTTITVENENGAVLASSTNRRILGTFTKQQWGGRKGDDALECGEVEFDATDSILLMTLADLHTVRDSDDSSDDIGRAHVDWSGPCYVRIADSICEYFGVDAVKDITEENLTYVRNRVNPQPLAETTVLLSVQLKVRVAPGVNMTEFMDNLTYSVASNTPGVTIRDTEKLLVIVQ